MAWILDTYQQMMPPLERNRCTHVVTGKPFESGGNIGRNKATGQGVVYVLQAWAENHNFDLVAATYCIQGNGNVGSWTTRLLKLLGARLLAVEDHTGAIALCVNIYETTPLDNLEWNSEQRSF